MKIQKLITIDIEVMAKLKAEPNSSELINDLLLKHYKEFKNEKEIIEDVKEKIKAKEHEVNVQKMVDEQLEREREMGFTHEDIQEETP